MSLRKFIYALSKMQNIRPLRQIAFQGEGTAWQLELSFQTNSVSDIFTVVLHANHVERAPGKVLVISTSRVGIPRSDNVHPLHLAEILHAIGDGSDFVIPSSSSRVRRALEEINVSMYTWRGTIWAD